MSQIILINDLIDLRGRKQKELEFYNKQLEELKSKMFYIKKEIDLTSFIETYQLEPEQYLFSRILEGDKSDNIIGIEGIGPKRAQQLAKEYKTLSNLLSSLPLKGKSKYIQSLNSNKDRLIKNEQLVSLKKYNKQIIQAAKDGNEIWKTLS